MGSSISLSTVDYSECARETYKTQGLRDAMEAGQCNEQPACQDLCKLIIASQLLFCHHTMNIFIPNHKVFLEIKRENIFIYQNSVLYRVLMVSLLYCSDETADGKRYADAVLRSTSRWTKPDGKGSLKQIFHSLYLPTLLHTSWKKQLFLIPVFSLS